MKRFAAVLAASCSLASLATLATPALAAWPTSPAVNVPVCTAPGAQTLPQVVSDLAGGAIVVWCDRRGATGAVYGAHLLSDGSLDPSWAANGVRVAGDSVSQASVDPLAIGDGDGGAFVACGATRVSVHHLLGSGVVDPSWPAAGVPVSEFGFLRSPAAYGANAVLASDDAGGVYLCWETFDASSQALVVLQHVLPAGQRDPAWPDAGLVLSSPITGGFADLALVADGAGGAYAGWLAEDDPTGWLGHVYLQRVAADGSVASGWPAGGLLLGTGALAGAYPGSQVPMPPALLADGSGGAYVAWHANFTDATLQHVLGSSAIDPAWPAAGVDHHWNSASPTQAPLEKHGPIALLPRAGGGVLGAFTINGSLTPFQVDPSAVFASFPVSFLYGNSAWWDGLDGPVLQALPDGAGGVTCVFQAGANTPFDIVAKRWLASGDIAPGWPSSGAPVCDNVANQSYPSAANDGYGGCIVAWQDNRANSNSWDIYAQRISSSGQLVGVGDPPAPSTTLALAAPSPNPVSRSTTLRYALPAAAHVSLRIHDAAGRIVRTLEDGDAAPGDHAATWDLADDAGRIVHAGLYFASLDADGRKFVRRIALVR